MNEEDSDTSDETTPTNKEESDVIHKLQMASLDYLLVNGMKDPALLVCSSHIAWKYLALWEHVTSGVLLHLSVHYYILSNNKWHTVYIVECEKFLYSAMVSRPRSSVWEANY